MNTSQNESVPGDSDKRQRPHTPNFVSSKVRLSTAMQGEQTGQLVSMSLGGFAVTIPEASGFYPGYELAVAFNEGTIRARVKYTVTDADARHRIGFRWLEPDSPVVLTILRRCIGEIHTHGIAKSDSR